MYYFHGDCIKCTKKIVGDFIREGMTKFIIYPFDEKGMKVKSILNVLMGIEEYLVVDDSLAGTYPNVRSLSSLTDEDLKDAVVLIASDEISDIDDMRGEVNIYNSLRSELYHYVPENQCAELFPKPRLTLDVYSVAECGVDLKFALKLKVAEQTAEYILENLAETQCFNDRYEMLQHVFCEEQIDHTGMIMEFGVFKGDSTDFISVYNPTRTVYGFDSFEGLPERWMIDPAGMYTLHGHLPHVKQNVQLVRGWFEDTIPRFIEEHKEHCSFIHIDCDLYSSTKTVLNGLKDRIVPGTVIVFDEYFNYPGWQQHEYRAFQEFVQEQGIAYEYICYCQKGQHVGVRIK